MTDNVPPIQPPEPEIVVIPFRQAIRPLLYFWLGLAFMSFMAGLSHAH